MWRLLPKIYFGSNIFSTRFFYGVWFVEELLNLIGLDGDTTWESVYNALVSKLDELGIPLDRCMSVTTYGAPAMVGNQQGLVARLRKDKQSLLAFHCIIHQTVLCGKLNGKFQAPMINHLKSKSTLCPRIFREFLHEANAKYDDLLTYNNVRWLSEGSALARIRELRGELNSFLETCGPTGQPFLYMLRSTEYTKRTKVFVHRQIYMYRLCHLSTKESVGNQDENWNIYRDQKSIVLAKTLVKIFDFLTFREVLIY